MLDPAVLARLIDLSVAIIIVAAAVLAWRLIVWRIRLEVSRRSHELRRRITTAQQDWPTEPARRPVNVDLREAA